VTDAVEGHEKKSAEKSATSYLVLSLYQGYWREVTTLEAQSADAAIRSAVPGLATDTKAEKFVAVPARSWKPREITIDTAPRVKLS
jgi:hypothetical protein